MVSALRRTANSNVELFNQAVTDLKEHIGDVEPTGKYTARHPLVQKFETEHILAHLSTEGVDVSNLEQRYEETNAEFRRFRDEHDHEFTTKLHAELKHLIAGYPGLICYFMELDPYEVELQHDLGVRDSIEILVTDLEERDVLEDEKLRVEILDDVFRCEYKRHIDEIRELVETDELAPLIEKPYLPSRFWWRHPSSFQK